MAMSHRNVEAAIRDYDPAAKLQKKRNAEQQRTAIYQLFPKQAWPSMRLEQYALGTERSEDSYCRWMEFRSMDLGSISGGAAGKHIIYKHKSGEWRWKPREAYASKEAAWQAVRAGFLEAFSRADSGEWDSVDLIDSIRPGSALLAKTLHVYYPNDVLAVYSRQHLKHYLHLVGRPEAEDSTLGVVRLNRALLSALRTYPKLSGLTPVELSYFLYDWADPRQSQTVLKIAPGQEAKYWDECLAGGYICVGWDDVGDLREFESKNEFKGRFEEVYGGRYTTRSMLSKKANEVWLLRELEPGDKVVANRGTSEVLAIGTVEEPAYDWDLERADYKHIVHVTWDTSFAGRIEPQPRWATVTVAPVGAELYATITSREGPSKAPEVLPTPALFSRIADALEQKGQVILYGPPGTGKTYTARQFAVWWLLSRARDALATTALANADDFRAAEKTLSADQLTLLTFHPSYAYEDFIEGFKPLESGDALVLRLTDGVFKALCRRAEADPTRPYLLLIDEVNRANVAKVFGEIITLLERDKRGLTVTLPQSKQRFAVPDNVFVVGTMNTADRSIRLLDAALRRRFAFVELMPDASLLSGGVVADLALDEFLDELNRRIAEREGREKQVGHAFLLQNGRPIDDPDEFARRFRQEMVPLLQEYCYDDYGVLAHYIGEELVDAKAQTLNMDILYDTAALVSALKSHLVTSTV